VKKVTAYNLSTVVIKEIEDRAKAENRSKSNWLDSFLVKAIFVDEVVSPVISKKAVSRFEPPSWQEVSMFAKANILNLEGFFEYYESNGWKVGRNKMKVWKSAAKGWSKSKPSTITIIIISHSNPRALNIFNC